MLRITILLALAVTPALAQPVIPACDIVAGFRATCRDPDGTVFVMPQIPDDDLKREALMLAYKMNGNSFVGRGDSIDLTAPLPSTIIKAVPIPTTKVPRK